MPEKTQQVAAGRPRGLLRRGQGYGRQRDQKAPRATPISADAVRVLLAQGLDAVDVERKASSRKK